jgi:hypothetical protein
MTRSFFAQGAVILLALTACRDPPRAWEHDARSHADLAQAANQGPSDAGSGGTAPGVEVAESTSLLAEAGSVLANEEDGGFDGPAETPVRVGGPWVRCYGNFKPSGEPLKDVTRLGLLCGPENGMRRLGDRAIEGTVSEGGAAATSRFAAKRGECYRVFAVAENTVVDLDVSVLSSHGIAVAADHGEDAWPIVQPDRPFCPLDDDTFSVEVTARRGNGRFAAEIWHLYTPSR